MKYFLLSIGFLLIMIGTYQYNKSMPLDEVTIVERTPPQKELLTEQQTSNPITHSTFTNRSGEVDTKKSVLLKQPKISQNSSNIPSPDELWLLQQKENRELDLLATIPDMPVISDEQLEAESAVSLQTEESNETESLFNNPLEGFSNINEEEVLAVESSKEVIPFELRELEALISNDGDSQDTTEELTEPLIDPETGISDKELMQAQDIDPPIEPEFLAN